MPMRVGQGDLVVVLIAIAVIMAAAALVQAFAVRGYVKVLLFTRHFPAVRRAAAVVIAWAAYAALTVLPLLVALSQPAIRKAVVADYAAVALLVVGFLFSLLPAVAHVRKNLPVLRKAGYFRRRW